MIRRIMRDEQGMGGFSLLGLLVVSVILIYLAMQMIPRYTGAGTGASKGEPGAPPTPQQRAESVECRSNLNQIRQAVTMYQSSNEKLPASLQELSAQGVSASISSCPVGKTPYSYDPRTGQVHCTYSGHERY